MAAGRHAAARLAQQCMRRLHDAATQMHTSHSILSPCASGRNRHVFTLCNVYSVSDRPGINNHQSSLQRQAASTAPMRFQQLHDQSCVINFVVN